MEKGQLMYEGKAKKVFATNDDNLVIIYYKDAATAFNAEKVGTIDQKGVINNEIATILYSLLEKHGIKTHFRKKLSEREQLCEKVTIIPLEFIVRNIIAGSMAKRLGIVEGTNTREPIFEICLKNDSLGDPLINDHHAVALELTTHTELANLYKLSGKINDILRTEFASRGITLVDFKIEFGRDNQGNIILADEISPDTCRLWDSKTQKKLDKDRFRRDLGNIEDAYIEVLNRLKGTPNAHST